MFEHAETPAQFRHGSTAAGSGWWHDSPQDSCSVPDDLAMSETSDRLFEHDRGRDSPQVCGADEAGRAVWAGPLVAAAVRFDYRRLDAAAQERLCYLNDSKRVTPPRRAALLPVIFEVADMVSIVVISAAEIDRSGGVDVANRRALASVLDAVAVAGCVRLVDWFDLQGLDEPPEAVKHGDATSAAIAAASIVAKETRDQLMRGLDVEYPGCGFAAHKGYGGGTGDHEAAIRKQGHLSPAHRRSINPKAYGELGLDRASSDPGQLSCD
jgi:ribonuclease HII